MFIEAIPVAGTKAIAKANEFSQYLKERNLKAVNYRTGRSGHSWSLDVYVMPIDEPKPRLQKNCKGEHIIHLYNGFFAKGENNQIIKAITEYMESNSQQSHSDNKQ